MTHQDDETIFSVVVNGEEQYSIWPTGKALPLGWREVGKTGSQDECLQYVKEVWTDITPLSARRPKDSAAPEVEP